MLNVTTHKKMTMKNLKIVSLIILLGIISCKKEKIDGEIKTDSEFASEL